MKTVYVKGKRMQKFAVEPKYVAVLQHSRADVNRATANVADYIGRHKDDADGSYLESDTHKRLYQRAVDTLFDYKDTEIGVAMSIINDDLGEFKEPRDFYFEQRESPYDTLLCTLTDK